MQFIPVADLLKKQTAQTFPGRAHVRGRDPVQAVIDLHRNVFGIASPVIDEKLASVYNVRQDLDGVTCGSALGVHVGGCPYRCAGCYVDHRKNAGNEDVLLHAMKNNRLPRDLITLPQDAGKMNDYIFAQLAEHEKAGGARTVTVSGGEPLGQRGWLVDLLSGVKKRGGRATVDTMGQALAQDPAYLDPFIAAKLQDSFMFHLSCKPVLPESFTQLTNIQPNHWVDSLLGTMQALHRGFMVALTGPIDNYWSEHEILTYYSILKAIDPELPRLARTVTWTVGEAFSQNAKQARTMVRSAGFQRPTGKTAVTRDEDRRAYAEHKFLYSGSKTKAMIPDLVEAVCGKPAIVTTKDNPAVSNPEYRACVSRIRRRLMAQDITAMPVYKELTRILNEGPDAPPEKLTIDPAVAPVDAALAEQFEKAFRQRSSFKAPVPVVSS